MPGHPAISRIGDSTAPPAPSARFRPAQTPSRPVAFNRRLWWQDVAHRLLSARQLLACCLLLLACLHVGQAHAAGDTPPPGVDQLLDQADRVKTSDHARFLSILAQLSTGSGKLSKDQRQYLDYLQAWQLVFNGDNAAAIARMDAIVTGASDPNLRFRANANIINILGLDSRYKEAFARLATLVADLPKVNRQQERVPGLVTIVQLYIQAGQHDLAVNYANQLLLADTSDDGQCKGGFFLAYAIYSDNNAHQPDRRIQQGLDACEHLGDRIYANGIRTFLASSLLADHQPDAAIALLRRHYAEALGTRYNRVIAQFENLLAQAYLANGDATQASRFALAAIDHSAKGESSATQAQAYRTLFEVAKAGQNWQAALGYHEQYMAIDKAYRGDSSARAVAYEVTKLQMQERQQKIAALSKQNQILRLQRTLDRQTLEISRLYIALLALAAAAIALLALRLWRSQLRFKRMAHRDGLTGAFNRQQFVALATSQLLQGQRANRDLCVAILDMDHFKPINDQHGHAMGDRVLQIAVQTCQSHLRTHDLFGRLGGEEFGILLPDCSLAQSRLRIEQIRTALAAQAADAATVSIPISASFGIAHTSVHGYELGKLLIHADAALYRSKHEGRNRVSLAGRDETSFDWPAASSSDPDQPVTLQ